MDGPEINARLEGLEELILKLKHPVWVAVPMRGLLDSWRFKVQRQAVANMKRGKGGWVDTGETRKGITSAIDDAALPLWARAGSNLDKARWGEYGTGKLSEDPESDKGPHWPPPEELQVWALKHGFKDDVDKEGNPVGNIWRTAGGKVSKAIGIRGGLEPRRFLRDATDEIEKQIPALIDAAIAQIEAEAERQSGATP